MKAASLLLMVSLLSAGRLFAAEPAHSVRQATGRIVFHYGVAEAASAGLEYRVAAEGRR